MSGIISEGKVIDFKPLENARFIAKNRLDIHCRHAGAIEVDEQNRTIECQTCKCVLDPFDYFWQLAQEETRLDTHVKHLKKQILSLLDEKVSLEKRVNSLKRSRKELEKTSC